MISKASFNGTAKLIWPVTILLIVLIGATTTLIALGHSNDVKFASLAVAQGIGFLLQFWVTHRENHPTEARVAEMAELVATPDTQASLGDQVAENTRAISQIQQDIHEIKLALAVLAK